MFQIDRVCSMPGCTKPFRAKGLCITHYERLRRRGSVQLATPPFEVRFWSAVEKTKNCWFWTASRTSEGYGQIQHEGTQEFCGPSMTSSGGCAAFATTADRAACQE